MSRGLKNNNPLNIVKDKLVWQGEKTPSTDPRFKQFISLAYGYRAAFVNLGTYNARGWNTIAKILIHWAPPKQNNTENYIRIVEGKTGINRDKVLKKVGSKEDYIKIVAAMSFVENGVPAILHEVRKGFELQNKLF